MFGNVRSTRRLTMLQTMCNVLNYRKRFKNGLIVLRFGYGYCFFQSSTVTSDSFMQNARSPESPGKEDPLPGATVLVLIKLTKFAVALRLRCGSCKLIF